MGGRLPLLPALRYRRTPSPGRPRNAPGVGRNRPIAVSIDQGTLVSPDSTPGGTYPPDPHLNAVSSPVYKTPFGTDRACRFTPARSAPTLPGQASLLGLVLRINSFYGSIAPAGASGGSCLWPPLRPPPLLGAITWVGFCGGSTIIFWSEAMTDNAKKILEQVMEAVTAEKAVHFVKERVFSDGISIPCKKWSYLNQFVTYLSGTADARGFLQWKDACRNVTKGAQAIYILVPMLYKAKTKSGETVSDENEKELKGFKAMPVFRVEDTEGAELDYEARLREFDPSSLPLIDVARALGVSVSAGLTWDAGGWFRKSDNSITMGSTNGQVFLHELSHAVDNALPGKADDYAFNEVVADLAAAFLCTLYGVDCNVDNTNAYIRGWAGKSAQGAFTFVKALERVEEIYHYIEKVRSSTPAAA